MSYAADIESIFNPCNLDEDCSYIAHLLSPYEIHLCRHRVS